MMAEPISRASISGRRTATNRRCQVPFWAQRKARLRTVSGLPKRSGSTHQVPPWCLTHSTAFKKQAVTGGRAAHFPCLTSQMRAVLSPRSFTQFVAFKPHTSNVIVRMPWAADETLC